MDNARLLLYDWIWTLWYCLYRYDAIRTKLGLPESHITKYINGPGVVTKNLVSKSTGAKDFNHIFYYQLNNIVKCLNKNKKKPKIVCGHYHLESPGYYSTNTKLKELLMPLFKKYNVKAYVCGHEHLSEHRTICEDGYSLEHFIAGGLETRPLLILVILPNF